MKVLQDKLRHVRYLSFKLNEMQNSDMRWMATKADTGLGIEIRRKQNIVSEWDGIMDRWTNRQVLYNDSIKYKSLLITSKCIVTNNHLKQ